MPHDGICRMEEALAILFLKEEGEKTRLCTFGAVHAFVFPFRESFAGAAFASRLRTMTVCVISRLESV